MNSRNEKKNCPAFSIPTFKLGYRSYIELYAHDKSENYRRYRLSFNLVRIRDLTKRKERAKEICWKIEWWLNQGKNIEDFEEYKVLLEIREREIAQHQQTQRDPKLETPALEALEIAYRLKFNPKKNKTNKSYRSHVNRFSHFLEQYGHQELTISEITREIVYDYLDYYRIERKVLNNTLNNVLIHMKSIFYTLMERGYIPKEANPFAGIKPFRKEEKIRKNFNRKDAVAILNHTFENDKILFYSIILQYACLIRPSELLRLRFFNIYPEQGIIVLDSGKTKNGYQRTATIPKQYLRFFFEDFWTQYPGDYYIFGKNLLPNRHQSAGDSSLYRRHKKMLRELKDKGVLQNLTGLTYYSWKDTGVTDIIDSVGLMAACDQAGHANPETTLRYRHKQRINQKVRDMNFREIGKEE